MVSRPELGSDPPFGSGRESGRDSCHPRRVFGCPENGKEMERK